MQQHTKASCQMHHSKKAHCNRKLHKRSTTFQKHIVNKKLYKNELHQHAKAYCKMHHHTEAYI